MAGVEEPTVGELHRTMTQLRTDTNKGFERLEAAIADLHRDFVPTAVFDARHGELTRRVDEVAARVEKQESSRRLSVTQWVAGVASLAASGSWLTLMLK